MNKYLSLLIIAFQISTLSAQNITISVKKGTAKINNQEWLVKYPPKIILKTDKISVSENAILLVRKGSSVDDINCPCPNLSYSSISKKLSSKSKKNSSNSRNISYLDIIFNQPIEADAKSQINGATRGIESEIDTFSINLIDSAWIMNDEYFVQWKSDFPSKQLGNMKLYKKDDVSSPIVESEKNIIQLQGLSPGWYQLDFDVDLTIGLDLLKYSCSYVFLIPTNEEKLQVQNEIIGITEELNKFENEELKSIILDEYKTNRRLYGLNE